jgi:hypothetical protein
VNSTSFLRQHAFVAVALLATAAQLPAQIASAQTDFPCPTTQANEFSPGDQPPYTGYGNAAMWASLWRNGTIVFRPGGAGLVMADGSLRMKQGWWRRSLEGRLVIEGRRLDEPAPPLRYEERGLALEPAGFNPSYLIFPTPGCWEVTGRVGNDTLTFVTRVVKIAEGPIGR